MTRLTVKVPENLMEGLRKKAEEQKKGVEEIVVESIKAMLEQSKEEELDEKERMEKFVRESGLFAPPEDKLGPGFEKFLKPFSEEDRQRLAKALSRGKSLSEIIIEDRG